MRALGDQIAAGLAQLERQHAQAQAVGDKAASAETWEMILKLDKAIDKRLATMESLG